MYLKELKNKIHKNYKGKNNANYSTERKQKIGQNLKIWVKEKAGTKKMKNKNQIELT
jgi:hypothetical protein